MPASMSQTGRMVGTCGSTTSLPEPSNDTQCPCREGCIMTELIVETDLGHDPDDFFTLCYLAAAGVQLRAICVVPGDRDQLAVARMLVETLGLDIPVGASKLDSSKYSSGGMHHTLLDQLGYPKEAGHDGSGDDVI